MKTFVLLSAIVIVEAYLGSPLTHSRRRVSQALNANDTSDETPVQRIIREQAQKAGSSKKSFDQFKTNLYDTADAAKNLLGSEQETSSLRRLSQLDIPQELRDALPDLQASNPIRRKRAERKLIAWQKEQDRRKRDQERKESFDKLKGNVYAVANTVASIPGRVSDTVSKTVDTVSTIPDKVQENVEVVKRIPKNIEDKTNKAKQSIKESQEIAKLVAEDIRNIPNQVKQNIQNTKDQTEKTINDVLNIPKTVETSYENTKENWYKTRDTINSLTTPAKVILGIEKPSPKPPKTPPPQLETSLPKKIATATLKTTGKAAWWATKGVAGLTWTGTKFAAGKAKEAIESKISESRTSTTKAQVFVPPPQLETDTKPDIRASATETVVASATQREPERTKAAPIVQTVAQPETKEKKTAEDESDDKTKAFKVDESTKATTETTEKNTKIGKPVVSQTRDEEKTDKPSLAQKEETNADQPQTAVPESNYRGRSVNKELDDEVAEALRLAQEALDFADK